MPGSHRFWSHVATGAFYAAKDGIQIQENTLDPLTSLAMDLSVLTEINEAVVPHWLPEGAVFDYREDYIVNERQIFFLNYSGKNEADLLTIIVTAHGGRPDNRVQDITEEQIEYYVAQRKHIITYNENDIIKAIWSTPSYEVQIYGHLTYDEITAIIESIYW